MKNKFNKLITAVLIIVLLMNIYLITSNYFIISKINLSNDFENIFVRNNVSDNPLSVEGFKKVDSINLENDGVILRIACDEIKLASHEYQLYSIERGLKGLIDVRPMIHDNIKDIFDNYNITVLMAKITELDKNAYFGNLYLKRENEVLNIDSKPSDLIAISVRMKNPLYVKEDIIKKYGKNICVNKV